MKKIFESFKIFLNSDFDFILFLIIILVIIIGLAMVYSASSLESYKKIGDAHYFFKKQIQNIFFGTIIFFYTATILKLGKLKRYTILFLIISILLLIIVMIPGFGIKSGGAVRWLNLKFFRLQPSEIIKIALILFFAHFYEMNQRNFGDKKLQLKYYIKLLIIICIIAGLIIIEPDYSTALLVFILSLSILFVMRFKFIYIAVSILLVGVLASILAITSTYRMRRILAFLNPWSDPLDKGYHIIQSYIAINRGGIWGQGLGNSIQKLGYLPECHTDFIFAIIGEELGLIGSIFIIFLYMTIIWRGFKIALNNKNNSYFFIIAFGITLMFTLQIIINISVVSGLLPTTGIALPFISYGGSSLIIFMFSIGLLINISKEK